MIKINRIDSDNIDDYQELFNSSKENDPFEILRNIDIINYRRYIKEDGDDDKEDHEKDSKKEEMI